MLELLLDEEAIRAEYARMLGERYIAPRHRGAASTGFGVTSYVSRKYALIASSGFAQLAFGLPFRR